MNNRRVKAAVQRRLSEIEQNTERDTMAARIDAINAEIQALEAERDRLAAAIDELDAEKAELDQFVKA